MKTNKAGKKHPVTVTGIVVPSDWDRTGRLAEVVICGPDESEMVVAGDKRLEMFHLCHHRLRVTGLETRDERGRRSLLVDGYAVLGDEVDCGYEAGFRF